VDLNGFEPLRRFLMRRQEDNSILEMALVGYTARRDAILQTMADIRSQLGAGAKDLVGSKR
jgi:hypothetical protein